MRRKLGGGEVTMKTVVREGIWAQLVHGEVEILSDFAYDLRQPRQSRKQSMRGVSLAVDAVKDEHEAEAVGARSVLEHFGQLDCQLRYSLAPRRGSIPF